MSSALGQYIDELKLVISEDWTNLDIARYIYIDLGKKMSFDTRYSFGNKEQRQKIYKSSNPRTETLNAKFEEGIIICNSLSEIYKYILKQFGIEAFLITEDTWGHVYNQIKLFDGFFIIADLQRDVQNIRTHCKTRFFGASEDDQSKVISEGTLKAIDKKQGYISEDNDYADTYFNMLQLATASKETTLDEKVKLILDNLDVYSNNKQTQYVERKLYHQMLLRKCLSFKEQRKTFLIDCYEKTHLERKYTTCVAVEQPGRKFRYYIFSEAQYKYVEIEIEDLAEKVKNGLIALDTIPGLKQYINKQKQKEEGPEKS